MSTFANLIQKKKKKNQRVVHTALSNFTGDFEHIRISLRYLEKDLFDIQQLKLLVEEKNKVLATKNRIITIRSERDKELNPVIIFSA